MWNAEITSPDSPEMMAGPLALSVMCDLHSGGYNLEGSHACDHRLMSLVLLIAIAYRCAVLQGKKLKQRGVQKYIGRVKELKRIHRRHSSFWVGLYGQLWVAGMEVWSILATQLMHLKPHKLSYFKQGLKAMKLIQSIL